MTKQSFGFTMKKVVKQNVNESAIYSLLHRTANINLQQKPT